MSSIFKKLLVLFILNFMVSTANAESIACALLSFNELDPGVDRPMRLALSKISSNLVDNKTISYRKTKDFSRLITKDRSSYKSNRKQVMRQSKVFYVRPGFQTLDVMILDHDQFNTLYPLSRVYQRSASITDTDKLLDAKQTPRQFVSLIVEPNIRYVIGLENNNVVIKDQIPTTCLAKENTSLYGNDNHLVQEDLPEVLELQLSNVMEEVEYKLNEEQKESVRVVYDISFYPYLGIAVDETYTNDNSIKVLTVQPLSTAYKMGLRSGDLITHLGKHKVRKERSISAREQFGRYFQKIRPYDTVEFIVRRNGKVLDIKNVYELAIVAANNFHFEKSKTNYAKAQEEPNSKYQQLIMSLSSYYLEKGLTGNITLSRKKNRMKPLGLSLIENDNAQLQIVDISNGSEFAQAGMLENDILISVNGFDNLGEINKVVQFY